MPDLFTRAENAVIGKCPNQLAALLKRKPELLTMANDTNQTLVLTAAKSGSADCLRMLINAGADVKTQDIYGLKPLYHAALAGSEECVKMLLAAQACESEEELRQAKNVAVDAEVIARLRELLFSGKRPGREEMGLVDPALIMKPENTIGR